MFEIANKSTISITGLKVKVAFLKATLGALALTSFICHGQTNQPNLEDVVTLYLPISSNTYPDLPSQLKRALQQESIERIQVKNTDFWHPYQQGLRDGHIGVYFAQPHFAAWAITQHRFRPLYKLHGKLEYVLATHRANASVFELNDLIGKVICREAGLNLGTVWLNQLLSEYQVTVNIKEVASVNQAMQTNKQYCDAYVIDDHRYGRINHQQQDKYIRLAQSSVYKHNAFIAHPGVSLETTEKIKKALKSKAAKEALEPYFKDLSKWQNLQAVKADDYGYSDTLLLNAYWRKNKKFEKID